MQEPLATKKLLQEFAKAQNLGLITFVIENKVYLVDTYSFKVIKSLDLPKKILDKSFVSPFYTRVKKYMEALFILVKIK